MHQLLWGSLLFSSSIASPTQFEGLDISFLLSRNAFVSWYSYINQTHSGSFLVYNCYTQKTDQL